MIGLFLIVFTFLFVGAGLAIAHLRSGSSALGHRPRRTRSLTTSLRPEEAVEAILRFAREDDYTIPAVDLDNDQLVLEEPTSAMSWGFFFPVSVSRATDDATLVEVGIMSKLIQVGPIVTRSHEKCVRGIEAALFSRTQQAGALKVTQGA